MIIVDYREKPNRRDKSELVDLIRRLGVKAEKADLPYGDIAFDGYDSHGPISIGIERKRLHDMLSCIDDSRLVSHQRLGMAKLYRESWLLLEGIWRPHDPKGLLMEGNPAGEWWECKPYGRHVLYSKLRRYLFSVQRSGLPVIYTRDMLQTAYDICELYHYYQKRNHTSLLEIQKANIPALNGKPSLVRKWAEAIDGVGLVHGDDAARFFKTPIALAMSDPHEWAALPRISLSMGEKICQQILGKKTR